MAATYTYNDGIEHAKLAVAGAWEESGDETYMNLVLSIMGKLERLKRPTRRRITDEDGTSDQTRLG